MNELSSLPKALTCEEAILGFMRYAQLCHWVESFPLFPDPRWETFLHAVNEELGDMVFSHALLPTSTYEDILFALEVTTIVDSNTCRMRFNSEGNTWGWELGRYFPELAGHMFRLSQGIRGFAEVGE
jgi:hypothetical protein